ncbi:winged helix-turn-helix domain-containing protein [Kibdelosporangium lantanae]
MALRVRMTPADLVNIRFARTPAPMLEATLAFSQLGVRPTPVPRAARPLFTLIRDGRGPMFLDPLVADPDWAVELVETSPRALIRSELTRLWRTNPPLWLRNLADGDAEERQLVGTAVRAWYDHSVAPTREWTDQSFYQDVRLRGHVLARSGMPDLLNSIHPDLAYRDGVLELPHPLDLTYDLEGQGFELRPTAHWSGRPLWSWSPDDTSRYILSYPVMAESQPAVRQPTDAALARLLGETRAAVLTALRRPLSTSDLAERVGVSLSSASQHATVLRDAGLIRTVRDGQKVTHSLTLKGMTLLGL